jgi:Tol biopolymer transport system component
VWFWNRTTRAATKLFTAQTCSFICSDTLLQVDVSGGDHPAVVYDDDNQISRWDKDTGTISIISRGPDGTVANGVTRLPTISADGQTVVFVSTATNLAGPTGGNGHVFLWSAAGGIVDLTPNANGSSGAPVISDDGTSVVFRSSATNLVAGDVPRAGSDNWYRFDRSDGSLVRITRDPAHSSVLYWETASPSQDGGSVVLSGSVLGPGGAGLIRRLYLWSRSSPDVVTQITQGDGTSADPTISADGRWVAFTSASTNLIPGETFPGIVGHYYLYLWDRLTARVTRLTMTSENDENFVTSLSADGRYLLLTNSAAGLTAGDSETIASFADVYLWTRSAP